MYFLQPQGAWALLGGAAILVLYLLKRQYTQVQVPSTFLWRRAQEDRSANKPMQKLKKNLLLLLQLLAVVLLALALMHPASSQRAGGEYVFIFDLSASMQAQGRMDQVKEQACSMLDGLFPGGAVTVIAAGDQTQPLITRSDDPVAVKALIRGLKAGDGGDSVAQALSLARAMAQEVKGLNICVFSDGYTPPAGADHSAINAGPGQDNRALVSFTLTDKGDSVSGVAQVANYAKALEIQVEAYVEDVLVDVRTLHLDEGQVNSVQLTLPAGTRAAQARLTGKDALAADDRFWGLLAPPEERWVAFAGKDNIFAETALALRQDIRLYRTGQEELRGREAALYVLSGDTLTISAAEECAIQAGALKEGPAALAAAPEALARKLLTGVNLEKATVARYRPLTGGTPILLCGEDAVMAIDENGCVLGFDLHESNFALLSGFPILMSNLLDHLLPAPGALVQGGACGGVIQAQLPVNALAARIRYPSGREEAAPCRADEAGLYQITVDLTGGETLSQQFFMHIPQDQSDVRHSAPSVLSEGALAVGRAPRVWTRLLALAAFLLLLIEWEVSRRGI